MSQIDRVDDRLPNSLVNSEQCQGALMYVLWVHRWNQKCI